MEVYMEEVTTYRRNSVLSHLDPNNEELVLVVFIVKVVTTRNNNVRILNLDLYLYGWE
jgi:hypothetical protein